MSSCVWVTGIPTTWSRDELFDTLQQVIGLENSSQIDMFDFPTPDHIDEAIGASAVVRFESIEDANEMIGIGFYQFDPDAPPLQFSLKTKYKSPGMMVNDYVQIDSVSMKVDMEMNAFMHELDVLKVLLFKTLSHDKKHIKVNKFAQEIRTKMKNTIQGFVLSYLESKEANQLGLRSIFQSKINLMLIQLRLFRRDLSHIMNIINPELLSAILEQYPANNPVEGATKTKSGQTGSRVAENIVSSTNNNPDVLALLGRIDELLFQAVQPKEAPKNEGVMLSKKEKKAMKNKEKQEANKAKKESKQSQRGKNSMSLDELKAIEEEQVKKQVNPMDAYGNETVSYSSHVCDGVITWFRVVEAYFDAAAFLFTSPVKAFALLNAIWKQQSSYRIVDKRQRRGDCEGIVDDKIKPQGASQGSPDGEMISNPIDPENDDQLGQSESWDDVFNDDTNNRSDDVEVDEAAGVNSGSSIDDLPILHDRVATPTSLSSLKFSQLHPKMTVSDCHLEVKSLYVLSSLRRLLIGANKQRMVLSSSTGSGKSVFLPLIQLLMSYYDTTSIYYSLTTSSKRVVLPNNYLSYQADINMITLESNVLKTGYCLSSDIKTNNDAKWVINVMIKNVINYSPHFERLREMSTVPQPLIDQPTVLQNPLNRPTIIVDSNNTHFIDNIKTKGFSVPSDLPFVFLLLPSIAIVNEKMEYFTKRFDTQTITIKTITTHNQLLNFKKLFNEICIGDKSLPSPILFLSTPSAFLNLTGTFFNFGELYSKGQIPLVKTRYLYHLNQISAINKSNVELYHSGMLNSCRIILDEAHERSVELDVVLAQVSKMQALHFNRFFVTPPLLHQHMLTVMSATPDPDQSIILSPRDTCDILITTTLLYPVTPKVIIEKNANAIMDRIVPFEASQMINDVVFARGWTQKQRNKAQNINHKVPFGDCLIFAPGQRECERAVDDICQQLITRNNPKNAQLPHYIILTTSTEDVTSTKSFYNCLLDEVRSELKKSSNNKSITPTFLLPLTMMGKSSSIQKRVACNPLPSSDEYQPFVNVCKIIAATNSVESSVTIDGLTMLVDSGLHKENIYDIQKGISTLSLRSITEDSRTQRQGRVGRTQPATMVQIKFQDDSTPDSGKDASHALPELLSLDPSRSLIELRTKGIILEQINPILPTPLQQDDLELILTQLDDMKLVTHDGLTPLGQRVARITAFSPLYTVAILEAFDQSPEFGYFTLLTIIVMASFAGDSLYYTEQGSLFYNIITSQQSDVVTHVMALLALLSTRQGNGLSYRLGVAEKPLKKATSDFMTTYSLLQTTTKDSSKSKKEHVNITHSLLSKVILDLCTWVGPPAFNKDHILSLCKTFPSSNKTIQLTQEITTHLPSLVDLHQKVDMVLLLVDKISGSDWLKQRSFDFNKKEMFRPHASYTNSSTVPGLSGADNSCVTTQDSMETRFYTPSHLPQQQLTFPNSVIFINKTVNASFENAFSICSTFHSMGATPLEFKQFDINTLSITSNDPIIHYDGLAYQMSNEDPVNLSQSTKANLYVPEVYTLQLHQSFFSSPFAEPLLDVLLGEREEFNPKAGKIVKLPSYELEARARFSNINRQKGRNTSNKKDNEQDNNITLNDMNNTVALTIYSDTNHPRTYIEIALLLNRIRAITPLFTNSLILSRKDEVMVEFVSSIGALSSLDLADMTTKDVGVDLVPKRIFAPRMSEELMKSCGDPLQQKPYFYPINEETIAFHEDFLINNGINSTTNIGDNTVNNQFYPTVIIPSSPDFNFFGLSSTTTDIQLTESNTALSISFEQSSINLLTDRIQIVYVSDEMIPFTKTKELGVESRRDFGIFEHFLIIPKLYSHSNLEQYIFVNISTVNYWIYPVEKLYNSDTCEEIDNIWAFYYDNAKKVYHELQNLFGQNFDYPIQPGAFTMESILSIERIKIDHPKAVSEYQLLNSRKRLSFQNLTKGVYLLPEIALHWWEYSKDYLFNSRVDKTSSYALVSAQPIGSNFKVSLSAPPILNTYRWDFCQKKQVKVGQSHPIESPYDSIVLAIKRPSGINKVQFKDKIELVCKHIDPIVMEYRINKDGTQAWLTVITDEYIRTVVNLIARAFGCDLTANSKKLKGDNLKDSRTVVEFDFVPQYHQVEQNVPDGMDQVPNLSEKQLYALFSQSPQSRELYSSIINNFSTPLKSHELLLNWRKRFLVTLTPIFISLKNIIIYLSSINEDNNEKFHQMMTLCHLQEEDLANGFTFSRIGSVSHLFQIYRHVPTASDEIAARIVHPLLQVKGQGSSNELSNRHLGTVCSFIRPLLSKLLCLLPSDISIPFIFSNICLVVFARHPPEHLKNLQRSTGIDLSDVIQVGIQASMQDEMTQQVNEQNDDDGGRNNPHNYPFEVSLGPTTTGVSYELHEMGGHFHSNIDEYGCIVEGDGEPSEKKRLISQLYEFSDVIEDNILATFPANHADGHTFSTQVRTRLFESNRAIRYLTPDEIKELGLVVDDDDSDTDDDGMNDQEVIQPNEPISFKNIIGGNVFAMPNNPIGSRYFQLIDYKQPFIEWYNEKSNGNAVTITEGTEKTKEGQDQVHAELWKKFSILLLPSDQLWVTKPTDFFDTSSISSYDIKNNEVHRTEIVFLKDRFNDKDINPSQGIVMNDNIIYHGSKWMQTNFKSPSIAYCPPHTMSILRSQTRRHPEYNLSFFPIDKETTFVMFDTKLSSEVVRILNQPPKTIKSLDLDEEQKMAIDLQYRVLGQMSLSDGLPNHLHHIGPDNCDQLERIKMNYLHSTLSQRLTAPLPISLKQSNNGRSSGGEDEQINAYYCCCEAPALVYIPTYTHIINRQEWIYTGLLPQNRQSDHPIHTISSTSSSLSPMYHTPFSILPGGAVCIQCFGDVFHDQVDFARISDNATTVSLKEPNSQTRAEHANLFMTFVSSFNKNRSVGVHYPLGGIIVSIFNEARQYYKWQRQHELQSKQRDRKKKSFKKPDIMTTQLHPAYTQASVGLQLYLSFKAHLAIENQLLSKLPCCPHHPIQTVIWPWEDRQYDSKVRPKRCQEVSVESSQRQCEYIQCQWCYKMAITGKCECQGSQNEELGEALNLVTPCCQKPYTFDGCCAVSCSCSQNINFCAFCHKFASTDIHGHVKQCPGNPKPNDYFCDAGVLRQVQRKTLIRPQLLRYFTKYDVNQREALYRRGQAFAKESFQDEYGLSLADVLQACAQ